MINHHVCPRSSCDSKEEKLIPSSGGGAWGWRHLYVSSSCGRGRKGCYLCKGPGSCMLTRPPPQRGGSLWMSHKLKFTLKVSASFIHDLILAAQSSVTLSKSTLRSCRKASWVTHWLFCGHPYIKLGFFYSSQQRLKSHLVFYYILEDACIWQWVMPRKMKKTLQRQPFICLQIELQKNQLRLLFFI